MVTIARPPVAGLNTMRRYVRAPEGVWRALTGTANRRCPSSASRAQPNELAPEFRGDRGEGQGGGRRGRASSTGPRRPPNRDRSRRSSADRAPRFLRRLTAITLSLWAERSQVQARSEAQAQAGEASDGEDDLGHLRASAREVTQVVSAGHSARLLRLLRPVRVVLDADLLHLVHLLAPEGLLLVAAAPLGDLVPLGGSGIERLLGRLALGQRLGDLE